MNAERWRTVEDLFYQASELPRAQRAAWLERACEGDTDLLREVTSLLDSDDAGAGAFVEAGVRHAVVGFHQDRAPSRIPQRVGPYRILDEIGRGGMGTVYLAVRDDDQYRKRVAIKLVRRGMDTDFILARFRRERLILARLEHPNIARFLDAGSTDDGLPYLVMEYVDGAPITRYCDENKLGVEQRLRLFLQVCSAVEYAHGQFIVHRDVKPGNILIDASGVPKLLDFGISKLLYLEPEDATVTETGGLRLMTPDYASPEQIRGEPITIAADIYSLAAVLYELVTGLRPHRIDKTTPQAVERAICDEEVVRPSVAMRAAGRPKAAVRRIAGDLDTILMRGLQKEAKRRYASVEQFSEDLRRHLNHLPVIARPDTLTYRAIKFARRNRGTMVAAAAVLATLLAGVFVSAREARIARQHFEQVRGLANRFVFDVHDAVRDLPGSVRARQIIVQTALQYLDTLAGNSRGDAELQRELAASYQRLGEVQGNVMASNLGDTAGALQSYSKALALLDSVVKQHPADRQARLERLVLLRRIGDLHSYTRGTVQAMEHYTRALQMAEEMRGRHPGDRELQRQQAELYAAAGRVQRVREELTQSLESYSRALSLMNPLLQAEPQDRVLRMATASARAGSGMVKARLGRLAEALEDHQAAVAELENLVRQEPSNVTYQRELMLCYSHVGDTLGNPSLANLGASDKALEAYRKMLQVAEALHQADPADQRSVSDLGIALHRVANALPRERAQEKLTLYRRSLELMNDVAKVNPKNLFNLSNVAFVMEQIGDLAAAGDPAAAMRWYRESLAASERILREDPRLTTPQRNVVSVCRKLSADAARRGLRDEALNYANRALQIGESIARDARPGQQYVGARVLIPRAYGVMGSVHSILAARADSEAVRRADLDQARQWYERSLSVWRRLEKQAGFIAQHRRDMNETEAALSATLRQLQQP